MLTTLDTSRLVPRQQPQTTGADASATQTGEPVFTIPELVDLLENRPEIREALRQSLIDYTAKQAEKRQ